MSVLASFSRADGAISVVLMSPQCRSQGHRRLPSDASVCRNYSVASTNCLSSNALVPSQLLLDQAFRNCSYSFITSSGTSFEHGVPFSPFSSITTSCPFLHAHVVRLRLSFSHVRIRSSSRLPFYVFLRMGRWAVCGLVRGHFVCGCVLMPRSPS